MGTMKFKNCDLNEGELRLGAADFQLSQDRIVRTGLLAIVAFGVAALVWMAVYLVSLSSIAQEISPREKALRAWTTIHAPTPKTF